jgi:hypothetical protein
MATDILVVEGTPIVWADTTDYDGDGGARTHQILLAALASTAAREGAKADLTATRGEVYAVTLRVEIDVAPVSGTRVGLYWNASPSVTAGTANAGGCGGADAAYTGTASDSLADSILQLDLIGNLILTADAATVVQQQTWMYMPPLRYGSPVVWNETSGQAFEGDDIEMSITFTPLNSQSQ